MFRYFLYYLYYLFSLCSFSFLSLYSFLFLLLFVSYVLWKASIYYSYWQFQAVSYNATIHSHPQRDIHLSTPLRIEGSDRLFCIDKRTWTSPTHICKSKAPIIVIMYTSYVMINYVCMYVCYITHNIHIHVPNHIIRFNLCLYFVIIFYCHMSSYCICIIGITLCPPELAVIG